jgi:hypothetical protein
VKTTMKLAWASGFVLALAACSPSTGAEGEGEGEGEGEAVDGTCTAPTDVTCRDEAFVALSMNLTDTAGAGKITNTPSGAGFTTEVDATAGGFNATGPWVYGKFAADGLTQVDLLDDASFESMDWDIAFRRFVVRLNSGNGGPSCVQASRTAADTNYDDVTTAPDNLSFNAEQFMDDACDVIADGSGLPDTPGVVLQNWWNYDNGCVGTTGNVYVVRTADGAQYKLVLDQYYENNQAQCNSGAGTGTGGGNLVMRWQRL